MAGVINGALFSAASHFLLHNPINSEFEKTIANYTIGLTSLFFCFPVISKCAHICDEDTFSSQGESNSEFISALLYYTLVLSGYILCNLLAPGNQNDPPSTAEIALVAGCNAASNVIYKLCLTFAVKPFFDKKRNNQNLGRTHYGAV